MTMANEIGGRHGVGIGVHLVENRFVGVKSRGIYEAPGMELLGSCYAFLLQLILDRRAREVIRYTLAHRYQSQLYQGYWNDVATRMARKAIAETAALVTGTVTVSLYKGVVAYVSTSEVPHSLFSNDSSMEDEGSFDHKDSEGFARCPRRPCARTGLYGADQRQEGVTKLTPEFTFCLFVKPRLTLRLPIPTSTNFDRNSRGDNGGVSASA